MRQRTRHCEEEETKEDIESYLDELVAELGLSTRVAQEIVQNFEESNFKAKLSIIRTLESEIENRVEEPELVEESRVEEDEFDKVNQLWEDLMLKSLSLEKRQILGKSFYAEKDCTKRYHMYLEFSSYLRPVSESQRKYADELVKEKQQSNNLKPPLLRNVILILFLLVIPAAILLNHLFGGIYMYSF